MADDCNNPNCGWFLYEIEIDVTTAGSVQIGEGKTIHNEDPKAADKPTGDQAVATLKKIKDDYNDSKKLTMPFKKDQCQPCECKPVGDPEWEKNAEKGWKVEYMHKGWTVSCDATVKQGKQPGVCKNKKKVVKAGEQ